MSLSLSPSLPLSPTLPRLHRARSPFSAALPAAIDDAGYTLRILHRSGGQRRAWASVVSALAPSLLSALFPSSALISHWALPLCLTGSPAGSTVRLGGDGGLAFSMAYLCVTHVMQKRITERGGNGARVWAQNYIIPASFPFVIVLFFTDLDRFRRVYPELRVSADT